jgi:crotonobetainyl-CoA:carnitine CoA-transferase CaiB-like acyl-CoA transferase
LSPNRRPYPTKDGYISVIAHSDAQWSKLFAAMGKPELFEDPRFCSLTARSANIDAAYATLVEGMKNRTTDEWLDILKEADIPCGRANTLQSLFADEYLQETNFFEHHDHPVEGDVVIPAIPARFSATPANIHRPWPTLGQHTREILSEAGYAETEIDAITAR